MYSIMFSSLNAHNKTFVVLDRMACADLLSPRGKRHRVASVAGLWTINASQQHDQLPQFLARHAHKFPVNPARTTMAQRTKLTGVKAVYFASCSNNLAHFANNVAVVLAEAKFQYHMRSLRKRRSWLGGMHSRN